MQQKYGSAMISVVPLHPQGHEKSKSPSYVFTIKVNGMKCPLLSVFTLFLYLVSV